MSRSAAFHPELLPLARLIPRVTFTERTLRWFRRVTALRPAPRVPSLDDVVVEDRSAPGSAGAPAVPVRLYRPRHARGPVPALVWIHGGGMIIGDAVQDQRANLALVRELGIAVVSVDYRLAPEHPFPAPLDDCYAALHWVWANGDELGIRPDRVAVGGASAGGGLAAGLALMAADRAEVPVVFQLLVYPMLDDRTTLRADLDDSHLRLWNRASNAFGWAAYLYGDGDEAGGGHGGGGEVSPYAAPARRDDLAGLAPAWLGVGTCDLFHDEGVAYARRLAAAGVACHLQVVLGGYHAFDVVQPRARLSREFRAGYVAALRQALVDPPT